MIAIITNLSLHINSYFWIWENFEIGMIYQSYFTNKFDIKH